MSGADAYPTPPTSPGEEVTDDFTFDGATTGTETADFTSVASSMTVVRNMDHRRSRAVPRRAPSLPFTRSTASAAWTGCASPTAIASVLVQEPDGSTAPLNAFSSSRSGARELLEQALEPSDGWGSEQGALSQSKQTNAEPERDPSRSTRTPR